MVTFGILFNSLENVLWSGVIELFACDGRNPSFKEINTFQDSLIECEVNSWFRIVLCPSLPWILLKSLSLLPPKKSFAGKKFDCCPLKLSCENKRFTTFSINACYGEGETETMESWCLRDLECWLGYLNSTNYCCVQVDNQIVASFPTAFFLLSMLYIECRNLGIVPGPSLSFVRMSETLLFLFRERVCNPFQLLGKCKQQKHIKCEYTFGWEMGENGWWALSAYKPFRAQVNGFEALVMLLSS